MGQLPVSQQGVLPLPGQNLEAERRGLRVTSCPTSVTESKTGKHVFRDLANAGERRDESRASLSRCSIVGCCGLCGARGG